MVIIVAMLTLSFAWLPWPPGWPHLLLALGFLVPGRLQGLLWRDFFRGRRALEAGRFHDGHQHFLDFESRLSRQPWLRHAICLQWSFYTWNARAMLANNFGACALAIGDLEQAEQHLKHALSLDPGYPLPYFTLAVLAHARGETEPADHLLKEAASRGYRGGTRDRMIALAGSLLASVEGRP